MNVRAVPDATATRDVDRHGQTPASARIRWWRRRRRDRERNPVAEKRGSAVVNAEGQVDLGGFKALAGKSSSLREAGANSTAHCSVGLIDEICWHIAPNVFGVRRAACSSNAAPLAALSIYQFAFL
jgi:hypothetical protein